MRKRRRSEWRDHLLHDRKQLRAAVRADAEILRQACRVESQAFGAAARGLERVGHLKYDLKTNTEK
jgi:hypothetical protein